MIKPMIPLSPLRREYPFPDDHRWIEAETFEGDEVLALEGTFESLSSSLLYSGTAQFYMAFAAGFYAENVVQSPLLQGKFLQLYQSPFADDSLTVGFGAQNLTASTLYQLPPTDGAADEVLTTDSKGNLSWSDGGAGKLLDATYILQQPHDALTKAQALNALEGDLPRILKANEEGVIEVAIPDEDYATVATLEKIRDETEEFKNEAQQAAEEASASAEEAAGSATEAAASATEATGAAAEASGAAAEASLSAGAASISAIAAAASALAAGGSASSASSSASDASDSADAADQSAQDAATSLNTLLTTPLTLLGDVQGIGLLSAPIVTVFKDNPVLPGTASVTLPGGTQAQRPSSPILGMLRFNLG